MIGPIMLPIALPRNSPCTLWLALGATLILARLAAAPLTKGPYLQAPAADAMTIRWETLVAEPGTLQLSEGSRVIRTVGPIQPVTVQSGATKYYVYEANLDRLKPNTRYTYEAAVGADRSPPRQFKTFGTAQDKVTFIAYGDTRTNPDKHTAVAAQFRRHAPEFILHSGDLVAKGSQHELWAREFFNPLAGVIDEIPMLPSIGNHEQDGANYLAYFREPGSQRFYYSCDIGPVHIVSLDYHSTKPTDEQYTFVARDLEASRAPWKIVLLHAPMFNFGGHASLWGHDAYLPLFRRTQVDLVIAGHSHLYERFRPLVPKASPQAWAIQHLTTGGGGAPLAAAIADPSLVKVASVHHFVLFTATRDRIEGRSIDIDGREIDAFSLQKENGRQPASYLAQAYPEEEVIAAVKRYPAKKKKETGGTAKTGKAP